MCPFLDDEDEDLVMEELKSANGGSCSLRSQFFKNDKKFFFIGGGASIVAFCVVAYIMYSSSTPVNLDELPVIGADDTPLKVKPETNEQVRHQDKIIYDNISGDKRKIEEKIAQPAEEILSIPEIESGESLSDEEKKNIIQAFDELAPEKEYKIKYVKKSSPKIKAGNLVVVENEYGPPVNRIEEKRVHQIDSPIKKQRSRLKELTEKTSEFPSVDSTLTPRNGLMVQIASVTTKSAVEAEYNRILAKNKSLKGFGKKIIKVDLGEKKGIRYRIQIGPFKNKGEADKIVSSMKKNGFDAYISK
ncbi:MAG: SPOR domain-containing protein [Holosporaceae bacterium]|jgi:cell division protein FtsN|nr:SPOR domain-containing protein [Holosporaceae bacterium]